MSIRGLLLLLFGCSPDEPAQPPPPNSPMVPNPAVGRLVVDLAARGTIDVERRSFLFSLPPDEGESCVEGWMTDFLAPSTRNYFAIPAEPYPGMEFAIPAEISSDPEVFAFDPPAFYLEGGNFAWYGGTWTFITWTAELVEIELEGGVTCEFDGYWSGVPETCVPDSGTIRYEAAPGPALELVDAGYRGKSYAYTDPVSGEPLCHHISTFPSSDEPTGE